MRSIFIAIIVTLLVPSAALAQLSFPTSPEDYPHFYPTAYFDQGGVTDWNCLGNTYSGHMGSDFGGGGFTGMAEGRDIVAAVDAVVMYTNDGEDDQCTTGDCAGGGGYGNYVWTEDAQGNEIIYAHLATWSVAVSPGDTVTCGQLLGAMGSSGHSTGPHLHFEIRDTTGTRVDPFAGPCSSPTTLWAAQGPYDGLPAIQCGAPVQCVPVDTLTCGASIHTANDAPGSTEDKYFYGCTEWMYTGPEICYEFITDRDEPVTVSVTQHTEDLDLYAIDTPFANGEGCMAASDNGNTEDESMLFDAGAADEVYLVIDGYEGATSEFLLEIHCEGGLPDPPEDAGTDADSDIDSDADADTDADAGTRDEGSSNSCGCFIPGASAHDPGLSRILFPLL